MPYGWPPPPRANAELIGHEDAERALLEAYESGRLAHAWLICGPRGIGKATLAFRFARFLLAGGGSPKEGSLFGAPRPSASLAVDPESSVFHRVASGGHLDLITVERRFDEKRNRLRAEIVVDDVRAVGTLAAHTAAEGGWRIAVVDSADEMNVNAANALLKVLEEPPARTILLLIAHNPERILATIRSRCRRLNLRALDVGTVTELVCRYRPGSERTEAEAIAHLADGSIGRALILAEQGGAELHADLIDILGKLPELDILALDRFGDRATKKGADETFALVADHYRRVLARIIRAAGGAGVGEGGSDRERALVERLAAAANLDRWLEVWDKTGALLGRVDSASLDRKQVLLILFVNLHGVIRT